VIDWNGHIRRGMWLAFVLAMFITATVYDHVNT
jgi:hypothetical protein